MATTSIYMIGVGTATCDDNNSECDVNVSGDSYCIDLTGLVNEGYIGSVPISPRSVGSWSSSLTGYTLQKLSGGNITVAACEYEGSATSTVSVSR